VDKTDSIVDGFDGRAGLAESGGDIDVAVDFQIKVVFGADHGQDLAGSGFGDEGSSIRDIGAFEFGSFGGNHVFGVFLSGEI